MKCILLLHGFLSDPNDFDLILENLKQEYDFVHLVTFPGHGMNYGKNQFTSEETFELLHRTFDGLNKKYDCIDVMGYSMGGALAIYLSQVRRVNRLILLAPAYEYINLLLPFDKVNVYMHLIKKFLKARKEHKEEMQQAYQERLQFLFEDEKKGVRVGLKNFLRIEVPKYILVFRKVIKRVHEYTKAITVPTLLIWGKQDQLIPEKSVEEVFTLCNHPQSKKIIYEDVSHLVINGEHSQKVIEEVMQFIREK
ncbi:MAG: alpha/beta hydrolase [Bacilli bacterium]|jgi:esterase/lipase|nr:alpha/beta hydrolase [Bacilli bacterium]MDY0063587.1 alpha/beta hydrolase [Bacilli bacterium]